MTKNNLKLGWIGAGRMGFEMAQRLAKAGCDITVWNRTRAKAEPLAKDGARIASHLTELSGCDIVFCMVSTLDDVKEVIHGPEGLLSNPTRERAAACWWNVPRFRSKAQRSYERSLRHPDAARRFQATPR
jgi:3-hydroxyisobutyrate dehydrogenase-like beta-hydroxyacid dehydrogenase